MTSTDDAHPEIDRGASRRPLIAAGTLLGMGMGGFLDGILFHQILQTHNMLTAKRPKTTIVNVEINMFWDGLFHAGTWLMTALGLWLLWRAVTRPELARPELARHDTPLSGKALFGAMVFGWGVFNLVEGVIDHHVLQLHHVVERLGVSVWDWAFLASGVLFIAIGLVLIRSAGRSGA